MSGTTHLSPETVDEIFVEWENNVFAVARAKSDAGDRQDGGAVVIQASDVRER